MFSPAYLRPISLRVFFGVGKERGQKLWCDHKPCPNHALPSCLDDLFLGRTVLTGMLYYYLLYTGRRGQPSYYISCRQLEFLIGTHFTLPAIARLLDVSTTTVTRCMRAYGIGIRRLYSQVSDRRLNEVVREITLEFPSAGYRLIQSHLQTRGYRLTERRVRLSVAHVDPNSVAVRWTTHNAIRRRIYRVAYTNALWHIDGNMSLVRWGFVTVA